MKQQKLKEIKKSKVLYLLVWRQQTRGHKKIFGAQSTEIKSTLAWISSHSNRSKVKLRFPHLQQNSKAATRNILATALLVVRIQRKERKKE